MSGRTVRGSADELPSDAGLYRDLLDAAPDALLIVDDEGIVVYANAQVEALFGYERSEILGQSIEILVPARHRAPHVAHRAGFSAAPRKRPMGSGLQLAAVRKDGTEFPVEISLSPHRASTGILYSAAIRDVTERVRVEHELRRARAEAEQASAAKSRFLAAASHDLRQPLQAAILYGNILKRQLRDTPNGETASKLQSSLDALRDLLNRLLDVSRLEAGAITPELRDLSVPILFERLEDEFAPQAAEKGVELRIRTYPWRVRSDAELLMQLLRNLISNALRYTERGGVLVGCRRAGPGLRIQVWDTGIGIAPQELEAIFEEFYLVANAARQRLAGIGLGLAIVRGLSRLLGHPVRVRSVLGRGSVFEVLVPIAVSASGPTGQEHHHEPSPRPAVVAVIDDDQEVLDSLRLTLEEAGHQVIAGPDPDSLLRDARRSGRVPDLILSDYRLSENITGAEAIRRLRRELGATIPAIVITGDSSRDALRDVAAEGHPILHKPVDPSRLEEMVRAALGRARSAAD